MSPISRMLPLRIGFSSSFCDKCATMPTPNASPNTFTEVRIRSLG